LASINRSDWIDDVESEEINILKERRILRQYYKQLKAGIITIEDVPAEYRPLLMKYYGVN